MPSHSTLSARKLQVALLTPIFTDAPITHFSFIVFWSIRFKEVLQKLFISQEKLIRQLDALPTSSSKLDIFLPQIMQILLVCPLILPAAAALLLMINNCKRMFKAMILGIGKGCNILQSKKKTKNLLGQDFFSTISSSPILFQK